MNFTFSDIAITVAAVLSLRSLIFHNERKFTRLVWLTIQLLTWILALVLILGEKS